MLQFFWVRVALAATMGGVAVAGWAPMAWVPVVLLSYGALLWLLFRTAGPLQAALLGGAFGIGLHAVGDGWVFSSMHDLMNMSAPTALAGSAVFIAYLSLFTAIPCALWRLGATKQPSLPSVLAWAAWMTLGEYARSLPFNGFTSLSLGYAFVDTWLLGIAPVLGVYGISLLGFAGLGCMALIPLHGQSQAAKSTGLALALVAAAFFVDRIDWVEPAGRPLQYRLLQIDVPQSRKFDPAYARRNIDDLLAKIESRRSDLIVSPETVFPVEFSALPAGVVERLEQFSRESGSQLLLGSGTVAADGARHNSVLHIAPTGQIGQQDRVHLTALGEYTPAGLLWFSREMNILPNDLSAGRTEQPTFDVGTQRIGSLICNEDMTSVRSREWLSLSMPPTLFINPSNLAWFDRSLALQQRQQLVRLRAAESGRPVLRVANTGVTAHIDARGHVVALLPEGQSGELNGSVQGTTGLTPYATLGDTPTLAISLAFIAGGLFRRRRQANQAVHDDCLALARQTER